MFSKRSSRGNEQVPRRRRIAQEAPDDGKLPVFASRSSKGSTKGETQSVESNTGTGAGQFRRNQTLSSYRHNTPEESSRQKVHHLASQRRKISGIFMIVAIAVVLLGLLLWQLIAQVQITTSSKQLSAQFDSSIYEDSINEYLNLNPAQRLRFALDEPALSAFVAQELPEVQALEFSGMPGIARSNFVITFRTPVAGWQINESQFYVDADGVVFERNYYEAPTVQIVDESGISPEQGSAVVGSRLLGFLGKVVSQGQGRGYTVIKAALPAETTRQIDVYFEGNPTRIKLSIDRGAGEQIEDADRSIKYLQSRGVTPEFIDVRVAGRAAYK